MFDKGEKRKGGSTRSKNNESWNWAKDNLSADDDNKRRKLYDCIICGEIDRKFSEFTKPKP